MNGQSIRKRGRNVIRIRKTDTRIDNMVFPFLPCSSFVVSGQTSSGKTRFAYELLKHTNVMFTEDPPDKILYCYGIYQDLYREMEQSIPGITFLEGLPSKLEIEDFTLDRHHHIIVLDDLMHRVIQDSDVELLFTQGCHHRKFSVVFFTQNFFPKGTKSRTLTLITTYLILMKNVRDVSQVATLGRQISPGRSKVLTEVYLDSVQLPFGYLVIDMAFTLRTITD